MDIDVMELSPERVGAFDVVFFLGVLYHLRHRFLGLERARSMTKKFLIMETPVDLPDVNRPALAFYPGDELNNDWTNWWGAERDLLRRDAEKRRLSKRPSFWTLHRTAGCLCGARQLRKSGIYCGSLRPVREPRPEESSSIWIRKK